MDETEVEIQLVAPLAIVSIARRFTNSTDRRIEAVLTLPPVAPDEVLYRLVVSLAGVDHHAVPQPALPARRDYDAAVASGRSATLFELLDRGIPMIAIAGIEPGGRVEVLNWSVRPLVRSEGNAATLLVALSAAATTEASAHAEADALVTTTVRNDARLKVSSQALQVSIQGQPCRDLQLRSNQAIVVDGSRPILLEVFAQQGECLDHSEWRVDEPGGWEATSDRGVQTFAAWGP